MYETTSACVGKSKKKYFSVLGTNVLFGLFCTIGKNSKQHLMTSGISLTLNSFDVS